MDTSIKSSLSKIKYKKNWTFDNLFLIDTIATGKEKLKSNKLSRRKRQSIRIDIETFERYIANNYELQPSPSYKLTIPKDINKLKDYILIRMKKQYEIIGPDLIKWIIKLSEENIFKESSYLICTKEQLSIDEKAELTIKNYEKNSNMFLEYAKKIILDESIKQIQEVKDCGSYCHHDSITGQSYIIVDSTEEACIFNHEVQHAIEVLLKYRTNMLYHELGPIYHEMLFNEELYWIKGELDNAEFEFRIDEANYLLEELSEYFKILLILEKNNFDTTTDDFLKLFTKIKKLNPILVEEYLKKEIAANEMVENMNYLFSFLKAIELREKKLNSNDNQSEIINSYIKRKSFYFPIPKDNFKPYERYVKEMHQKVRKKSK